MRVTTAGDAPAMPNPVVRAGAPSPDVRRSRSGVARCLRTSGCGVLSAALLTLAATPVWAGAATPVPALPLASMRIDDAERSGTQGTGCTWAARPSGRGPRAKGWHMSMADDRAAVKRDGKLVILKPAAGAKDLFPFTHDRWTNGAFTIRLRTTGAPRQIGTEVMEIATALDLTEAGRTRSWPGTLNCGS